jgi:hypothetical protein
MAPANGSPTCVMGDCDFACGSPFIKCGQGCVDTRTDLAHCGQCGRVCMGVERGVPTCTNSQCGILCDAGYSLCSGKCVDTLTDKDNCGQCGKGCPGNSPCRGGKCRNN